VPYQNISASLSEADIQAVKDAFSTVLAKLSFLVNLTPDERKAVFKTGPDRVSFVQNASVAAKNNPGIFPASFDTQEFQKDVELFDALTELSAVADSVASQIDDTRLAVGGEAMRQATQVYNYVREASKMTPGLKPLAEQLGEHFQKTATPKQAKTPKA
jgi:hypothetical protein